MVVNWGAVGADLHCCCCLSTSIFLGCFSTMAFASSPCIPMHPLGSTCLEHWGLIAELGLSQQVSRYREWEIISLDCWCLAEGRMWYCERKAGMYVLSCLIWKGIKTKWELSTHKEAGEYIASRRTRGIFKFCSVGRLLWERTNVQLDRRQDYKHSVLSHSQHYFSC